MIIIFKNLPRVDGVNSRVSVYSLPVSGVVAMDSPVRCLSSPERWNDDDGGQIIKQETGRGY